MTDNTEVNLSSDNGGEFLGYGQGSSVQMTDKFYTRASGFDDKSNGQFIFTTGVFGKATLTVSVGGKTAQVEANSTVDKDTMAWDAVNKVWK